MNTVTIEFIAGYWHVVIAGKPLMSFASKERALEFAL
jgi:hypothetical protein